MRVFIIADVGFNHNELLKQPNCFYTYSPLIFFK